MYSQIAFPPSHYADRTARTDISKSFPPSIIEDTQLHQLVVFAPNAEIYAQGEPTSSLYQVEFGTVRIYRLLADGRRQITAFHVAGEFFGFEADDAHHFFAEAVDRCGIRICQRPLDKGLASELLPIALDALVRAQKHLLVIGRQCAGERVAAFLIDMMERQGDMRHVELAMSRTDIADYLGLTIETVSRAFTKFRERGYIRLKSARTIDIVDVDALRILCA
ncbi:Nitrogen fixation regulation protein FixK [Candidatus Filomicrobium marinum]|uniref:Nitrogen fixation regulation protein FixK n=2 Tax=Filomicrobium TaxID=119044 RepID=A0A0D6JHE0_9HYPH|nr:MULTISPECIES: helix-turn-helix domain-containing protein [Filomicrobium]MCV0369540.1 helix-turn-helix domain-containing protein [Filomicrobium sp.]CFX44686.1 Nitrogen fixation regulation protein FixK [Candidatus Filomicrobium marinum]CPR20839.1 Nitrogen fixation regulation protein FixK [Candidatus Filomicrobium marinum]SDP20068.1 transcriptional regulator, Crp/Fnr family [Filomicrobium insigne]